MIVVKGTHVEFEREDRTVLKLPATYGMLHDPEGADRPKCEVFFAPYVLLKGDPPDLSRAARAYLGENYDARPARTDLPVTEYADLCLVRTIWYVRNGDRGVRGSNERFVHPFRTRIPFWKKSLPLSKNGRSYRLVLGPYCTIDDRGFVFP